MTVYAAIVLAGGSARRMGGRDKPALPVGGVPMRERVLAAVADATPRILVGPGPAPAGVLPTRESPPGGGPVAATAAGMALLEPGVPVVALLAADLPLLTRPAVGDLLRQLDTPPVDGVCFVDASGRRQTLCGVWRTAALRAALDRLAGRHAGAPLRDLLAGLTVREVSWSGGGPPPWFDCDTDGDVRRAEEWAR
ncbi:MULTISPECIES: molybdenum cofactor guanylyltransferase [unclassified Micromonospora]|uniref:molybdenum cofactor guanylyltransferase n=1 Tax=unclassified Micromonospora TaxID=2617518 RepID=UPI001033829E|nr:MULTISPECIES: NTP transferase domain-containing protein [unclassified Micromonospora]QKW16870.1 NTP transferase domain-containing protein [Verrucosispora sp. NA02020]TBL39786.1 bifunctional protein IspD/ispF [Verrucosispora sp. SN26_14.1]